MNKLLEKSNEIGKHPITSVLLSFLAIHLAEQMTVTCSKCGGSRFELAQVSSDNTQQFTILHCGACGQSLGISEIEAIRHVLREQQSALNELKTLLNDVREKLGKATSPR